MSEGGLLPGHQALHEPEPFHSPCSQRVLPFPHLQGPVSGPHLRTVPVRAEDEGSPEFPPVFTRNRKENDIPSNSALASEKIVRCRLRLSRRDIERHG